MHSNRLIVLILILASFTLSFSFFKAKPRTYGDIAREIRGKVGKKLSQRHQMDCIGEGGGMMDSVYMMGLSFQIHHPMKEEEARERIVDCVEELLTAINENEEIRPFLKNYPFTTKNVQVSIFTTYPDRSDVFDPYIRVVSVHESNHITYATKEPHQIPYKRYYREPYEHALPIVNQVKNGSLL